MKEKPSLGYSLALYLSTVMWIAGTVGLITLIGGDMYHALKSLHWSQTIDELELSHEEYRLARAEMLGEVRQWREFYYPIEEAPWLPLPFFFFCFIGGAGYRIRKGMGEPVELIALLR
ncbi:MAG: hypothetical protein HRU16_05455 [Planctomycetes bacterium]|nr:hypothetical protein [Planctomycetota bacterium]